MDRRRSDRLADRVPWALEGFALGLGGLLTSKNSSLASRAALVLLLTALLALAAESAQPIIQPCSRAGGEAGFLCALAGRCIAAARACDGVPDCWDGYVSETILLRDHFPGRRSLG